MVDIIRRMIRPSLVLFDLDETLFDHRHSSRSGLSALQAECGGLAAVALSDLEKRAFEILNETHARVLAGILTQDEGRLERFRLLLGSYHVEVDEDEITRLGRRYRSVYRSSRQAVEGTIELLTELREHAAIGIVTNNFVAEQRGKLSDCGLDSLVHFMVTSEETGLAKPDPGIFHAALERNGHRVEQSVMVGDAWEIDVEGAIAAGIRPVWFNRHGSRAPETGGVAELHSFKPTEHATSVILGRPPV